VSLTGAVKGAEHFVIAQEPPSDRRNPLGLGFDEIVAFVAVLDERRLVGWRVEDGVVGLGYNRLAPSKNLRTEPRSDIGSSSTQEGKKEGNRVSRCRAVHVRQLLFVNRIGVDQRILL